MQDSTITISDLSKEFESVAYRNGFQTSVLFDDVMQYIIFGFTENHPPIKHWKYTKEQNKEIFNLMKMWFQLMNETTKTKEWFDAWGNLYESIIASKGRRDNAAQFFTPSHLCDLMAKVTDISDKAGKMVSDPTCGSGRNLLAYNAIQKGNIYVGEDLDRTCCLMTVCNMIIHGLEGAVIWHNTLKLDFSGGWFVNSGINNPLHKYYGIPHCDIMSRDDYEQYFLPKIEERASSKESNNQLSLF